MDPIVLSDSEEENSDPSGGENSSYSLPGFIMKGGKSDGKTDNMIGMKKNAPVTKKMKEVKMESTELSDSEEESVDPTNGSNSGGNTCYPHPGGKSDVKADNMIGVKKNAPATKKTKNVKIVDPTSGSKDGGNPCYSHPGGKSDAKADNMLGVKKRSPESKKAKKVKMEAVELSDYEEEKGDPSSGYSHP
ncbi:uncharacterized protein LOC107826112 [Nicotiana tabacum]|uniref:Uncharacterized protein LOC107826112 n=2 Tax=Nicotiana TaxID=4085 RepID=A0A1S4D541_TOBAC